MQRNNKAIALACVAALALVAILGALGFYALGFYLSHDSAIKMRAASIHWHKNVDPHNLTQVRRFARKFGFNNKYYIVCDFGTRSGKKRFYVYNLHSKKLIMQSYCMHGCGAGSTKSKPAFSDKPGSNASSLGLYVLSGTGSLKMKNCIRLKGLSKTNSNAYARGILIHSAGLVSRFNGKSKYLPIDPKLSKGCFTIENRILRRLISIYHLHEKNKMILLWAYCDAAPTTS